MFDVVPDVVTVVSSSVGIWATMNTTYRCISPTSFDIGGANVTFSNVRMEAYMRGNVLSPRGTTLCCAFVPELVPFFVVSSASHYIFFFVLFPSHRKRVCGRSGQHHSSTHYCKYNNNNNRSSITNPPRNAGAWLLLCKEQQWHRVSPGQSGSPAQRVVFLTISGEGKKKKKKEDSLW